MHRHSVHIQNVQVFSSSKIKFSHKHFKVTRHTFASENQLKIMALLCQVLHLRIGIWLHLVLEHYQASNSRCLFLFEDCFAGLRISSRLGTPSLKLPNSSVVPAKRHVFYDYSLSSYSHKNNTVILSSDFLSQCISLTCN